MYNPTSIEIGLINKCNLKCTLCARNTTKKYVKDYQEIDFIRLKEFLDEFEDLTFVSLVGSVTEPTLYKEILPFIRYLKARSIRIELSTNGTTNNIDFWEELGLLLTIKDKVIFGIDGSTQELHAEYRVGANLPKILDHHRAFKKVSKADSILQFIIFEHNEHDIPSIKNLYKNEGFSSLLLANCYNTNPSDFEETPIHRPLEKIRKVYSYLETSHTIDNKTKTCRSESKGEMYLNHSGQIMPCCHFNDSILENSLKCPTIYNSTFQDALEYCREIISNKDSYYECNMFCSDFNIKLQTLFDIDP